MSNLVKVNDQLMGLTISELTQVQSMISDIKTMKANILGLWKILESLKKQNKNKILFFFSSSEIYGDPDKRFIPTKENYNGNVSATGPRACMTSLRDLERL